MEIEFQITFQDFTEAQRVHHQPAPPRQQKVTIGAIVTLAAMGIATLGYWAGEQRWGPDAHPGETLDPLLNYLALPLLPWLMVLGSSIVLFWRRTDRPSTKPWEGTRAFDPLAPKRRRGSIANVPVILTFSLLACLAVFVFGQYTKDPSNGLIAPSGTTAGLWAVPMICWMLWLLWAWIANRIVTKRTIADSWELQTQLQRPLKIEFTAQGVVIDTHFSSCRHSWEDFPGVREAPTLFLLYISPSLFHLVPKRAFRSEEDLNGFRNMVQNLLGPSLSAFPVMPMAAQPLPTVAGEES